MDPSGASLSGVKGISVVAGEVQDNPTTPAVEAITQGGVVIYKNSHVYLHLVGGGSSTTEVFDPSDDSRG